MPLYDLHMRNSRLITRDSLNCLRHAYIFIHDNTTKFDDGRSCHNLLNALIETSLQLFDYLISFLFDIS